MKAIASELAVLTKAEEPSASVKQSILSIIEEKSDSGNSAEKASIYSFTQFKALATAAVLLIVVTVGLIIYSTQLSKEVDQQQATIQRLETEVEQKEELLTILEARDVDLVIMAGMENISPNGYGKVVWDKDGGRALLQVANLPSVPTDKDYQLWFILDGKPISAGVFAVDDSRRDNFFKIEQLQSSANEGAFAVTMEPKGGVPQPTGDMYLMGTL
jgi:anti-sigma-K factor RskA